VAYFLVHSMQAGKEFAAQDRDLAANFARACAAAGVKRIIYLGGLGESGEELSPHLASRREVEAVLSAGVVPVTTFRAAMIIGSGSASFEILRYLTERLPVMIAPRWLRTESQPISIRNVLHYLIKAIDTPDTTGRLLQIGGPDVVRYDELIQITAAARNLPKRIIIPVPVLTPSLSSLWIHLITPIPALMARPLAEGLRNRVVVTDDSAARLMPQHLLGVQEAIRLAFDAEERADVESSWSAAGPIPGDPDWAGGHVFEDSRDMVINASPSAVFEVLMRLGGKRGWFRYNQLWRLRGLMDRLVGGPGTRRGRRHPERLSWGEAVDFWRVVELQPQQRLTLRAEMRVPGDAVLDFTLTPLPGDATSTRLVQTARFRPRGLYGLLYWYLVLPFHKPVFDSLIDGIRLAAQAPPVARTDIP
ncbi:MAG TPA: SDR family oxidoreductase, partial [Vicinamibacterales bacterium]|nr:SDR family oxidoreductase [Vicinamibacterales bacterium]